MIFYNYFHALPLDLKKMRYTNQQSTTHSLITFKWHHVEFPLCPIFFKIFYSPMRGPQALENCSEFSYSLIVLSTSQKLDNLPQLHGARHVTSSYRVYTFKVRHKKFMTIFLLELEFFMTQLIKFHCTFYTLIH
jgi:hypothetical protein